MARAEYTAARAGDPRDPFRGALLSDDLYEHALRPPPVKFSVEDLLPWPEVQTPFRDGDDHFAPHDLALVMGVAANVVLIHYMGALGAAVATAGVLVFNNGLYLVVFLRATRPAPAAAA